MSKPERILHRRLILIFVGLVLAAAASLGFILVACETVTQEPPPQPTNYLVISEYEIGTGMVIADAIEEMSGSVRVARETGEYKSVRLFMHYWGPRTALYFIMEPKSWQAIHDGAAKMRIEFPDRMNQPFKFAGHSDNIVTEIPVDLSGIKKQKRETKPDGTTYLCICENEIAPGTVLNDAIEDHTSWVKAFMETGEFLSVRIFAHYNSPRFALYTVMETDSWQSIETGWNKGMEALDFEELMNQPWKYGKHTDNILTEIPVK